MTPEECAALCRSCAADITGVAVTRLMKAARQVPAFRDGGIGKYVGRIHVDCRGQKARWTG